MFKLRILQAIAATKEQMPDEWRRLLFNRMLFYGLEKPANVEKFLKASLDDSSGNIEPVELQYDNDNDDNIILVKNPKTAAFLFPFKGCQLDYEIKPDSCFRYRFADNNGGVVCYTAYPQDERHPKMPNEIGQRPEPAEVSTIIVGKRASLHWSGNCYCDELVADFFPGKPKPISPMKRSSTFSFGGKDSVSGEEAVSLGFKYARFDFDAYNAARRIWDDYLTRNRPEQTPVDSGVSEE